jgi:two-component system, chemotaxis family, sensor kinase CheA
MVDGGGRGEGGDKAREEFFSEAQELVDGLGRDLLLLDERLKRGEVDPEVINDVFRGVHTLKGLSGLFGSTRIAGLSHELEDVLDDLRLGRLDLTPPVLDLLFQAVALYARILASESGEGEEPTSEVEQLLLALGHFSHRQTGGGAGVLARYDLDPSLMGVLTEYEEHRLRANLQQGLGLYRIRVRFPLATIDGALDELKAKARPHGEIITYLPTGSGADMDTIELEILMASRAPIDLLRSAIAGPEISIDGVRQRSAVSVSPSVGYQGAAPAPAELHESASPPAATPPAPNPPKGTFDHREPVSAPQPKMDLSLLPVPTPGSASVPEKGVLRTGHLLSLRSVSQTVRVDIRKLDYLMTIVGELAIVRTALAKLTDKARRHNSAGREMSIELGRIHRKLERNLAQMQSGILEVRMVPLGQAFDKLARVVKQISRELAKEVNLVVAGAETEIDKLIVEELSDPLMHMIRNAIDHGIEARAERISVGKPPIGTIALNAFQKGNQVLIEVEDDGRGIDRSAVLAVAIRRGTVTTEQAAEMTAREVLALVFIPGFTTKELATDLSGRGVGLDVVKTNIAKLGGVVDIASEDGIGTKMTITLPITLAIIHVLLVGIGERLFAVPLASVEEAIVFNEAHVHRVESREVLTVRGASLPICRLDRLFGIEADAASERTRGFVVIAQVASRRLGFVVDQLVGQQDIVVKALGKSLSGVRGFAGATELGDQRIALVLDVAALIEELLAPRPNETRLLASAIEAGNHLRRAGGA